MSTDTILLIAVAVGVMALMVRMAHGSRAAADRVGESSPSAAAGDLGGRAAKDGQAETGQDGATAEQPHPEHKRGCC